MICSWCGSCRVTVGYGSPSGVGDSVGHCSFYFRFVLIRVVSLRYYVVSFRSSSFLPFFIYFLCRLASPSFVLFRSVWFLVFSLRFVSRYFISVRFCCVSRDFVFRFVFVSFRFVRFCCPCFCPDLALRTLWCKVHEA